MVKPATFAACGLAIAIATLAATAIQRSASIPAPRPVADPASSRPDPETLSDDWREQAQAALRNRRPDEAIRIYERADQRFPDDCEIAYNLSLAYKMTGRLDKAQTRREQADRLRPKLPPRGMGAL